MTDNKLTDKEIVKAYEFCLKNKYCTGCIADTISKTGERDCKLKPQDITDLINRLQAENEVYETCNARKDEAIKSLESRLKKLQMQFDDISKLYSEIKAEAYKECFAFIKEKAFIKHKTLDNECLFEFSGAFLDNLLKELVGDN